MDSTDTDVKDNNDTLQTETTTTSPPPPTTNSSSPSSPSCTTLLVIDDSSNSGTDDALPPPPSSSSSSSTTITTTATTAPTVPNTNNIPTKPTPSITAQTSDIPVPTVIPPFTLDITNGTAEQQRRRNSSIAKLLGGQPLNNHQYEEIHQQILEDQSAQNMTYNNDNGNDPGNQRPRSSITRTLLMNPERTNSFTKIPAKPTKTSSPLVPRDFEYLIRQELDKPDIDHSSSTLQRNNSATKIFQNLNSSTSNATAQLPLQSKLKRKRPNLPPPVPTSNIPPFSLHEPFELESSATNSTSSIHPAHSHSQSEYLHYDSSKRSRHSNSQQFNHPVNTSSTNQSSYPYSKFNMNPTLYNQFNIHRESSPVNNGSSSYNFPQYSHSTKLSLPTPVSHVSSGTGRSNSSSNLAASTMPKAKSMFLQTDGHDPPRQRSYSNTFNQSDSSLASSSEPNVPLKKRLLHAYNNEQRPTTPL